MLVLVEPIITLDDDPLRHRTMGLLEPAAVIVAIVRCGKDGRGKRGGGNGCDDELLHGASPFLTPSLALR
jgi:hypothetical protein